MIRIRLPFLLIIVFLSACAILTSDTAIKENTIPATVDRVVDGDTLKVTLEDREETISPSC